MSETVASNLKHPAVSALGRLLPAMTLTTCLAMPILTDAAPGIEVAATGLSDPLFVTAPPGDENRLFVVEQGGLIKIIDLNNNTVLATPFLNISTRIATGSELGLLGLAFHPNYINNGFFFIYYTVNNPLRSRVARFRVSGTPAVSNVADGASERMFLEFTQPQSNHNGGMLAFGPNDGYLYIASGDGGGSGDPGNNAQTLTNLLGKVLRIDVNEGGEGAGTGNQFYDIPPTNPDLGGRPEIWAYGLRNPWRFSFDQRNGDMYIGDVGQGDWEEIDRQPAASPGGGNYGWRLKEGNHCFNPPSACDPGGLTDPIYEYDHGVGRSVTGGYVYRGRAIPYLYGHYLFADFFGDAWSFGYTTQGLTLFTDQTPALGGFLISSFGEDARGELYIVDYGGRVLKIIDPDLQAGAALPESIGVKSGRRWFMDRNGNGLWDGCNVDRCITNWGWAGDQPLSGDWNNDGIDEIGVKRGNQWFLDRNGNGLWDGCAVDRCIAAWGLAGDQPLSGDWNNDGIDEIGVKRGSEWLLDLNGNGRWDGCGVDRCIAAWGLANDQPLSGDWNNDGFDEIGVKRGSRWLLDRNGSDTWNGCGVDGCIAVWGMAGDSPLAGRWAP